MSDVQDFRSVARSLLAQRITYDDRYSQIEEIVNATQNYVSVQDNTQGAAQAIAGWIGVNPSDEGITERILNSTYITTANQLVIDSTVGVIEQARLLPTEAGFAGLLNSVLKDDSKPLIMLTGPRGCGKTHAINYFISKHFRDDFVPNGWTFFRCDASKIRDIRALMSPDAGKMGHIQLREYIRAHNLYVALKYAKDDPLLKPFSAQNQAKQDEEQFVHILENEGYKAEAEFWMNWVSDPRIVSQEQGVSSTQFLADFIEMERKGYRQTSIRLNSLLLSHIRMKLGGRMLLIIDGVDNFSLELEEDIYNNLMQELITYFPRDYDLEYHKVIILLRHISYLDLRSRIGNTFRQKERVLFYAGTIKPEELLAKRISAIRNRDEVGSLYFDGDSAWDKNFLHFAFYTLECLAKAFALDKSTGKSVLDVLFSGNIRRYTRNMYLAYRYFERIYKIAARHSISFRGSQNLQLSQQSYLDSHMSIPVEASMLAGSSFMPTVSVEEETRALGRWCPNLFYFYLPKENSDPTVQIWHGLSMLRLLQLLDPKNPEMTRDQAILQLCKDFNYCPDAMRKTFLRALRYGLIQFVSLNHPPPRKQSELRYSRSYKGSLLLENIFDKPNVFYYMAASSMLPKDWHENTNLISLHVPRGSSRQFFTAAIKTGISFWRMLKKEHDREMSIRKFTASQLGTKEYRRFHERYKLPSHDAWLAGADHMYTRLKANDPIDAEDLLMTLCGQLNLK